MSVLTVQCRRQRADTQNIAKQNKQKNKNNQKYSKKLHFIAKCVNLEDCIGDTSKVTIYD